MLLQTLLTLGGPLLAFAATSHETSHHIRNHQEVKKTMDMRGLQRLRNSTLAGRTEAFPTNGITGVNLGAWFVFGESSYV